VKYVTLDYRAIDLGESRGPHNVVDSDEWADPCWKHAVCHSVEHAVELVTEDGDAFTISWGSPGWEEGIGMKRGRAIGLAVGEGASVAIWDVSQVGLWRSLVGGMVESVELRYEPWDETGAWWCDQIDVVISGQTVSFLLGEGAWESNALLPSADNIAVLFGSAHIDLPWRTTAK
jgi:hypothetical protein